MTTSYKRVLAIGSIVWATTLLGLGGAGLLSSTQALAATSCQAALPAAAQSPATGGTPVTGATPTIGFGNTSTGGAGSPAVNAVDPLGANGYAATVGGSSTGSGTSAAAGATTPATLPPQAVTPTAPVTRRSGAGRPAHDFVVVGHHGPGRYFREQHLRIRDPGTDRVAGCSQCARVAPGPDRTVRAGVHRLDGDVGIARRRCLCTGEHHRQQHRLGRQRTP